MSQVTGLFADVTLADLPVEKPDPLDVDYYGVEDAPRESSAAVPRVTGDEFLWRVLRKELIGVDLSNRKLSRAEIVKYQALIRLRLGEAVNASTASKDDPSNALDRGPLIELANRALQKLEYLKHCLAVKPTVNPSKAYRENLGVLNRDGKQHIRLYRCSKGATALHLEVFDLRTAPKFAAISYTWGQGATNAQVGSLPVTVDLKAALSALAANGRYEWLWLDAICINQDHPEEKSDQVRKMRQVYEKADAVFIWLGRQELPDKSTRDSDLAFVDTFFRTIGQGDNAWWSRLWVIQEVVSAKRAWVCTGHHVCSWNHFLDLVCKLVPDDHTINPASVSNIDRDRLTAAQARLKQLHELRKLLRSSPAGEDILDLLRLTNPFHCSNPRDKVYGLLGLATVRDQRGIEVDYSRSTTAVFASVVFHLADSKGRLDIMVDQWERHQISLLEDDLPSWVPDFRLPMKRHPTSLANLHAYNTSGGKAPSLRYSTKRPGELKVLSLLVGTVDDIIVELMHGACEDDDGGLDAFRLVTLPTYKNFTEPALRRRLADGDHYSSIARDVAPWRALLVDHGQDRMTAAPTEFGVIIDVLEATAHEEAEVVAKKLKSFGYKPLDLIEQVSQTQNRRSLLTTSNGFVGVGPRDLRKGDLIIVPLGASVPFVVRETSTSGKFSLVGDAYIHGIMSGEAAKLMDSGHLRACPITLV